MHLTLSALVLIKVEKTLVQYGHVLLGGGGQIHWSKCRDLKNTENISSCHYFESLTCFRQTPSQDLEMPSDGEGI